MSRREKVQKKIEINRFENYLTQLNFINTYVRLTSYKFFKISPKENQIGASQLANFFVCWVKFLGCLGDGIILEK